MALKALFPLVGSTPRFGEDQTRIVVGEGDLEEVTTDYVRGDDSGIRLMEHADEPTVAVPRHLASRMTFVREDGETVHLLWDRQSVPSFVTATP
jgi:hypothetical protein